jgi:REP element-mobilizing transposase RayT
MNRGRRGEEIFAGKNDYTAFIDLLKELVENYNIKIAAYSLISNHYHLLVQTPDANISRAMRHLNGVYTQRFNRIHNCDGQLFRGRYKSCPRDNTHWGIQCAKVGIYLRICSNEKHLSKKT